MSWKVPWRLRILNSPRDERFEHRTNILTRGDGTPDIVVHMETLRRYGLTELRPGQTVLVRFGPGPKGMMAAEVRPDGPQAH